MDWDYVKAIGLAILASMGIGLVLAGIAYMSGFQLDKIKWQCTKYELLNDGGPMVERCVQYNLRGDNYENANK